MNACLHASLVAIHPSHIWLRLAQSPDLHPPLASLMRLNPEKDRRELAKSLMSELG